MTEAGEVSSAFYYVQPAGAMDHRYSILEAQRAVGQLLDQVLTAILARGTAHANRSGSSVSR
jgi:hypothetical protein